MSRLDHAAASLAIGLSLVALLTHWVRSGMHDQLIEIDHAESLESLLEVDVNSAGWPELTLLPGISETYARRIVEHRERNGPFSSIEQLRNIHGIGDKTLDRLRPFVVARPISNPAGAGLSTH